MQIIERKGILDLIDNNLKAMRRLLVSVLFLPTLSYADFSVHNAYPMYVPSQNCNVAIDSNSNKYCMNFIKEETTFNPEDASYKTYYLAVGEQISQDSFNSNYKNIGIFITKNFPKINQSKLISQKEYMLFRGELEPDDIKFHKIGRNSYAYTFDGYSLNQGYTQFFYFIVGDSNSIIFTDNILYYLDNEGTGLKSEKLEGKVEFIANDEFDMYPIKVTLSGTDSNKIVKDKEYIFYYKDGEYQIPKDYPLN